VQLSMRFAELFVSLRVYWKGYKANDCVSESTDPITVYPLLNILASTLLIFALVVTSFDTSYNSLIETIVLYDDVRPPSRSAFFADSLATRPVHS